MKKLIIFVVLAAAGWQWFSQSPTGQDAIARLSNSEQTRESPPIPSRKVPEPTYSQRYTCDGRTYCSQMTSCAEATFFLKNCPGTKMDGDNDGVPCEKQWCGG